MKNDTALRHYEVPTTSLKIDRDKIDVSQLKADYQLYKLRVPNEFRIKKEYAKLHNAYKNQLDYPYYFYSYDKPSPTIYVLVKRPVDKVPSIVLNFLSPEEIIGEQADIQSLLVKDVYNRDSIHILMKLLMSSWFHKKYYTCQSDSFLIHSKGSSKKVTALSVSLRASKYFKNVFDIEQQATSLKKVDKNYPKEEYINTHKFYEKLQGEIYYRKVRTSRIRDWKRDDNDKSDFWRAETKFDRKHDSYRKMSSIKWFEDYEKITKSKGYLIGKFQDEFVEYCNETVGAESISKQRHLMFKLKPIKQPDSKEHKGYGYNSKTGESTGLFFKQLGTVKLYDNRFQECEDSSKIPFQKYIDFFNTYYGKKYDINFASTTKEELSNTQIPVIAITDVQPEVFGEDSLLYGDDDPYTVLNNEFSSKLALQNINVNFNDYNEVNTTAEYFDYQAIGDVVSKYGDSIDEVIAKIKNETKQIKELKLQEQDNVSEAVKEKERSHRTSKKQFELINNKIEVCLNELLLKYYIIHRVSALSVKNPLNNLPCLSEHKILTDCAYMHKGFLMYFNEDKVLQFIDLRNKTGKDKRLALLKDWGIDWFGIEGKFAKRNSTRNKDGYDIIKERKGEKVNIHSERIKNTRFVFSQGTVLAIEDTDERIVHKYDELKQGKSQRKIENKTALEGIWYSREESIYTVGYKSLNMTADDSVIIRKLYFYQNNNDFPVKELLQTLAVQFVKNLQYTVYPYFFHLLRMYRKDILRID